MDQIKKLLNRETILYIVFGAATTVVNYTVFLLLYNVCFGKTQSLLANAIAFIAAVVFAFVVNKCYVFESKSWAWETLKKEISGFLAARVGSFAVEELGLLGSELIGLGKIVFSFAGVHVNGIMIAKLVLSVAVVAINYVFCKLFIFKK